MEKNMQLKREDTERYSNGLSFAPQKEANSSHVTEFSNNGHWNNEDDNKSYGKHKPERQIPFHHRPSERIHQ